MEVGNYSVWNPATDALLPQNYTPEDLAGKRVCRDALLRELGLEPNPTGPVVAMVSRLAAQKGISLLLPIIDRLLSDDVRLVVLGEGDTGYERELMIACKQHAGRFAYKRELNPRLSHLIEAGADLSLIPSFYEPCGLTAMYGLKYGTLPVARATGGLHEILCDIDPSRGSGTGFLFFEPTAEAFWDAVVRARAQFRDTAAWQGLMRRAMRQDFSWTKAVGRYEALYQGLVRKR